MDDQNRDKDKKHLILPSQGSGRTNFPVSVDQIKSVYITEGVSDKEIADRFSIPLDSVKRIIDENQLEKVRADHVRDGLKHIQNVQVNQAQRLMDMEGSFKRMRIVQLEKILEDYMAYYARHGHFYKLHPITGEILKDQNGFPLQINIPNITKEIQSLKESVSLSEGLKLLLNQIDAIINKPRKVDNVNSDIIDVTDYNNLFKPRED
jgi:hypothetical protein